MAPEERVNPASARRDSEPDGWAAHRTVADSAKEPDSHRLPRPVVPLSEQEVATKWWDRHLVGEEMRELGCMALPLVFTYAAQHCLILVLFAFVGRSVEGEKALAVAGLASMFVNCSGVSIVVGLTSGLETLASQAYGTSALPPPKRHSPPPPSIE